MKPLLFDIHTHRTDAPADAFVNLPMEVLSGKIPFTPLPERKYSAGIHPMFDGDWALAFDRLELLSTHPQIRAIGECGLDKRSNKSISFQTKFFMQQVQLAEKLNVPLIIHCVRCWNELLENFKPSTIPFIIHGFRGKPQLARQLLRAGFSLSFGPFFNPESLKICPPERYYLETDDHADFSLRQVADLHAAALQALQP